VVEAVESKPNHQPLLGPEKAVYGM
jgi:hypothetical protein